MHDFISQLKQYKYEKIIGLSFKNLYTEEELIIVLEYTSNTAL